MEMIILSIHLVVCIALIGLVLLQRSEGGALGIGGGSGALMSGRGAADALAKMTYFAGGLFLIVSLLLTVISGAARDRTGGSVFDNLPAISVPAITQPEAPTPAEEPPAAPDPTQSSLQQPQLASAPEAVQPTALGPAPAAAGERAGPLANQPATAPRSTPQQTAARTPSTQQAAATRATSTAPTTVQRAPSTGGTTQNTAGATQRTQPLRLPGSDQAAAALNTVPLDAASTPESSEDSPLAPVRRERAGPDQ